MCLIQIKTTRILSTVCLGSSRNNEQHNSNSTHACKVNKDLPRLTISKEGQNHPNKAREFHRRGTL